MSNYGQHRVIGSGGGGGGPIDIADVTGLQGELDTLDAEKADLSLIVGETGVISGCNASWSGTGLLFHCQAGEYQINGTRYTAIDTDITLDAADANDPRLDRLVLTASGWEKRTGTPSSSPIEPELEPNEIPRQIILIEAQATVPADIDFTLIYGENAGSPTEYTATSTNGTRFNPNSTSNPRTGSKVIEATSPQNNDAITLAADATIDLTNKQTLDFWVRSKGTFGSVTIAIQFLNNSNGALGVVVTFGANRLGFVDTQTSDYQHIVIPLSAFQINSNEVPRKLRFRYSGSGSSGCRIDDITFQEGVAVGSTQNVIQSVEDENGSTFTAAGPSDKIILRGAGRLSNNIFDTRPTLQTIQVSTGSLAVEESVNLTVALGKSFHIAQIVATAEAWLRIYTSSVARAADASRIIDIDPTPGEGVIAEAIVGATPIDLDEGGTNTDSSRTANCPITVTNKSGSPADITITFKYLKTERD